MLHEQIKNGIKEAMMAKDTLKLETYRAMSAAFTNDLVAKGKKPNEMLEDAQREIRYPATAQLWVGGASVDLSAKEKEEKEGNKDALEYRATVEQALEDTFGPLEGRIKRDWLDGDLCIDYSLNVRTGEIHTEITSARLDDDDSPPEHRLLY